MTPSRAGRCARALLALACAGCAGPAASARGQGADAPAVDAGPPLAPRACDPGQAGSSFRFEHETMAGYPPPLLSVRIAKNCAVVTRGSGNSEIGVYEVGLADGDLAQLEAAMPGADPGLPPVGRDMPMRSYSLQSGARRLAFSTRPGARALAELDRQIARVVRASEATPRVALRLETSLVAPGPLRKNVPVSLRVSLSNRGTAPATVEISSSTLATVYQQVPTQQLTTFSMSSPHSGSRTVVVKPGATEIIDTQAALGGDPGQYTLSARLILRQGELQGEVYSPPLRVELVP